MTLDERLKKWGKLPGSTVIVRHPVDTDRDGDPLIKYVLRDLLPAHLKAGWRVVTEEQAAPKPPIEAKAAPTVQTAPKK